MKTKLLFLTIFTIAQFVNSQTTYVPDDNFEQALIDFGLDSGPLDDSVPTANINSITILDVSGKNISDLTGIEDFAALTTLLCFNNNNLISLDVSSNTMLTTLETYSTDLSSLNVSNNNLLISLLCANNQLTSLDVSSNPSLITLRCQNNQLITLNVKNGNNTNVINFNSSTNPDLTCIKVDDAAYSTTNWTNIDATTSFDAFCTYQLTMNVTGSGSAIPNSGGVGINYPLVITAIPNSGWQFDNWSGDFSSTINPTSLIMNSDKNITANFSPTIPSTYIPDDNFEQALIDLGYDSVLDDYVAIGNINTIATLDVSNKNISDLTGIEDFVALTNLNCSFNQLTSLDVSAISGLDILFCFFNQLSSINISNTSLTTLYCNNNQLASLDISTISSLENLFCNDNLITILDVSVNTQLTNLRCYNNASLTHLTVTNNTLLTSLHTYNTAQSASLDVSNNTVLTDLRCANSQLIGLNIKNGNNTNIISFDATNNPSLTCIDVDDVVYANANFTNIDTAASFSTDCNPACVVTIPDANFKTYLVDEAVININGDSEIQCSEASAFTGTINVNNLSISDLTGIEAFTALTDLRCIYNSLTSLDVSQNTALTELWCHNNSLTSLDVTQNSALTRLICLNNSLTSLNVAQNTVLDYLYCNFNSLTSLDISQNTALTQLVCHDNSLISLNVANGTNTNITTFDATNNPNLTCIEVDNVAYADANFTDIDAQTIFSINCSTASIQLSAKAYLQGAFISPNAGEETWMRDDLRVASLIPTTSPYTDALTVNSSVFTPTGANAIVDWVWVELRDENTNTNILASISALLQRDGDIVATDGISPLSFNLPNNNYFVAVSHRNHLGIISSNTVALTASTTALDLSNSFASVNGGVNAVADLGNGIFACYAGDFDGNDQIQNTDVSQVVNQLGNSGYSNADTDLNGQTQNTDINILINPNIGKGQQYARQQLNLFAKRRNN